MSEAKNTDSKHALEIAARLQVLTELTQRLALAQNLGYTYGGDRDLYQALGYKQTIDYADYYAMYKRHEIAKAVIDRPAKATWRGKVNVIENKDDKVTKFEKAWEELDKEIKIKPKLSRVDRLTGIGTYGILLLGIEDVKSDEDFSKPITGNNHKLHYLMPFSSEYAKIASYDKDPGSKRYGMPEFYNVRASDAEGTREKTVKVHYTRVIHIVDDPIENDYVGTPRLQAIYNRLQDLDKVVGGSGEMFWRGARPGYHGDLKEGFKLTTEEEEALMTKIDEYEHNLRRILLTEGININSLGTQVTDPKSHVDVIIQMISAEKNIPKRILTGSERGELSSAQDSDEWLSVIKSRREEFAEPYIIIPLVDRFIELGILPKPSTGNYTIEWEDLFSVSDKEKAEIGRTRAAALKEFMASGGMELIPTDVFIKYFLGLDDDVVELIMEKIKAMPEEEPPITPEEEEVLKQQSRITENQN